MLYIISKKFQKNPKKHLTEYKIYANICLVAEGNA